MIPFRGIYAEKRKEHVDQDFLVIADRINLPHLAPLTSFIARAHTRISVTGILSASTRAAMLVSLLV